MQNVNQTIISQYANSPRILAMIDNYNATLDPTYNLDLLFNDVLNIETAVGWGLDVIGRRLGVTRVIQISGGGYTLSDEAFQTLLYAKAAANIWGGSIPGINSILMMLFPGTGDNYIVDGQDMTETVTLAFTPTSVQAAIIQEILPRSNGVLLIVPSSGGGSLSVALSGGGSISKTANASFYNFAANVATVSGGSGSYTYGWTLTPNDSNGTWGFTGQGTNTATPSVTGTPDLDTTTMTLSLLVTDTITGDTATASTDYSFENTTVAGDFTVTIGAGATNGGANPYAYPPNNVTVTGGSGSFTYQWTLTILTNRGVSFNPLTGATTQTCVVSAIGTGTSSFDSATAQLVCAVTDTVSGDTVTSSPADYQFYFQKTDRGDQ